MKKLTYITILILLASSAFAQSRILYHSNGQVIFSKLIENVDSIKFLNYTTTTYNNINESLFHYPIAGIDSITFANEDPIIEEGRIIYIIYNSGNPVQIINPWSNEGVSIATNNDHVTVNALSGTEDIIYHVSGSTTDGSLTINSDHRFNLILAGANITNPSGSAIKIIDDVKVSVNLEEGTSTILSDGASSIQKATFNSEGQIVFSGNGTLSVTGNIKHAIFSNDYICILAGNIIVPNANTDGIHADYFQMYSGTLNINAKSSGIDGDKGFIEIFDGNINITSVETDSKSMKCDSTITINGGNIELTVSGNQGKGIKAGQSLIVNGGTINITASGATAIVDNDPSFCSGIKAADVFINLDADITIVSPASNDGAKCISADNSVNITGGTVELSVAGDGGTYTNVGNISDTYTASCIKGDIIVNISGGTIICTASGKDSKCISSDGTITISGGNITLTASGAISKGLKADTAIIFNGGTSNIIASGATIISNSDPSYCSAIKSDGTITINNGNITINCTSTNNGGKGISATGIITINGGITNITTAGAGSTYTNSSNTTDTYQCACIKGDGNIVILGGKITCQSTGTGGRGIACGGTLTIGELNADDSLIDIDITTSGAPVNATSGGGGFPGGSGSGSDTSSKGIAKGVRVEGNIIINSGHISSYCSQTSGDPTAEAIESKAGIYIKGGFVEANSYDDAINAATYLEISGGRTWAYARGNDGLDCNGTQTKITGGLLIVQGTEVGLDASTDAGGTFTITGGTIVCIGGNMGAWDNPTTTGTQKYIKPSISSIAANTTICVKNSSNNEILIFKLPSVSGSGFDYGTGTKPPGGGGGPGGSSGKFAFSSPDVTSGSYQVYTSGTISGGTNWHGFYTGASCTTSGTATSVTAQ